MNVNIAKFSTIILVIVGWWPTKAFTIQSIVLIAALATIMVCWPTRK